MIGSADSDMSIGAKRYKLTSTLGGARMSDLLKALNPDQARFVALLAKAARMQRDQFLGNVPDEGLAEVNAARGEHNPTSALGFAPVSPGALPLTALRDAVAELPPEGRAELYVLMRIGQGQLAAGKWHRGITEASMLGDDAVTALLMEDPDLHDHLAKGLYEAKLAS
jgi:hypothetical protein